MLAKSYSIELQRVNQFQKVALSSIIKIYHLKVTKAQDRVEKALEIKPSVKS